MHVTEKIVDKNGVHLLSSTLEADGPFELASPKATLDAKVIALRRTDSGGIFMQTAVTITEPKPATPAPAPEPEPVKTQEEQAVDYLVEKGKGKDEAIAAVKRFGVQKILAKRNEELDEELDELLTEDERAEAPADRAFLRTPRLAGSDAPAQTVATPRGRPVAVAEDATQPSGNAGNQNDAESTKSSE